MGSPVKMMDGSIHGLNLDAENPCSTRLALREDNSEVRQVNAMSWHSMSVRRLTTVAVLWVAVSWLPSPSLLASAQSSDDSSSADKSWSASSQEQSASGNVNPTRTQQSHEVENGRVVDKESTERLGPDGRYVPYLDVEKESVKVDANTTKTINRTFTRDSDGRRTLSQVTEEETRSLPGGGQHSTLTTSNPDANGQLQVVQREIQDTKQISPDIKETRTTVLTPSSNGGLAPSLQREERETRRSDQLTEFKKSTLLPDTNGNWVLNEVRQGAIRSENGKESTREENVLRPDNDGRLAVVERTIRKESESAPGDKQQTTETYSTNVPGGFGEGRLSLSQRVSTVQSTSSDGRQVTQTQTDARTAGNLDSGLRPTEKAIDIIRPGSNGKSEEQHTTESPAASGGMGVTWIDTRQSTKTATVQIDIAKPSATPAPKVNPAPAAKSQ